MAYRRRTLAALLALVASSYSQAQVAPTHNDLVYALLGPTDQPVGLTLDLYIPSTGTGPFPVIVRIHGGGWSGGSNQPIPGLYAALLDAGFAIASPRYRLTSQASQWTPSPVTFPAQIHDIKAVVRWVRAHSDEYNLDPTRIGSCGESAGGHLSSLLATTGGVRLFVRSGAVVDMEGSVGGNLQWSSRVYAAADYYGPSDLLNMNLDVTTPPGSGIDHDAPTSPESRLVGWDDPGQGIGDIRENVDNPASPYPALAALTIGASPITHVDPQDPPFFIAHGQQDTSVPVHQSEKLRDALQDAGVPTQYMVNPTGGHSPFPDANDAIVAFFQERFLTNPTPICFGNADANPVVDFDDIAAVLAFFNRPGGINQPGDADGDGTVNFQDIGAVLANWGHTCP
jgi:acetyl esterase/lipase